MLSDKIRIIERKKLTDQRGWFVKVIDGQEEFLLSTSGEIYLTMALPGEWRGNHYHYKTAEWFTVIKGKGKAIVEDIETKERQEIIMDSDAPVTLYAPAGVAHVFVNESEIDEMILIAYAENLYDPADTCIYDLVSENNSTNLNE